MANRKHALKDMTFVEFRERMAEAPVILLPLGSQEEQGPQGPMGDFMLSEILAERAAAMADAIAAPTLPFGYADVFRCLPGGIQLRADTFCAVLEDMVSAFLDHGLQHLVIFNGHTGNTALIDQTVRRLRRERGVVIPSINIWKIVPPSLWHDIYGDNALAAQGHGADPIASVYMHLRPELVRPDLVRPSTPNPILGLPTAGLAAVTFEGMPVQMPIDVIELNQDGMIGGNAELANAHAGAVIADYIVGFTSRFVRYFRACDPANILSTP